MSMTQTGALLLDAYRELNARKMFWITLVLSLVVVLAFAAVGLNDRGFVLFFWTLENDVLNAQVVSPPTFYKGIFVTFGVGIWLTWIAAILALISTATIFPDLVSAGSIDLILSKPIGRLRLFITKYLFGLLFVALQVTVFTVAAFFVLGFRGDVWEVRIFWAIPIVLVFFSYLFSVCAVLGVLTRSTIAALLLTLLFWFIIFLVHSAESGILLGKVTSEQRVASQEREIEGVESRIEQMKSFTDDENIQSRIDAERAALATLREGLQRNRSGLQIWQRVHAGAMAVKTVLPKTTETVGLLERYLVNYEEIDAIANQGPGGQPDPGQAQFGDELRNRSVNWILVTSLLFEFFVLAIGAWVFCRRDF